MRDTTGLRQTGKKETKRERREREMSNRVESAASKLDALRRYASGGGGGGVYAEEENAKKDRKKKKKKNGAKQDSMGGHHGLAVYDPDEQVHWTRLEKSVEWDVEDQESAPVIVDLASYEAEKISATFDGTKQQPVSIRPRASIVDDGSGWVSIRKGVTNSATSHESEPENENIVGDHQSSSFRRIQRHDSDDSDDSDIDVSITRNDASVEHNSDLSPPQLKPSRQRHDSDSDSEDLEVDRGRHGNRVDTSDSDLSPPRRRTEQGSDSDLSPTRQSEKLTNPSKRREPTLDGSVLSRGSERLGGFGAETVYRKDGKKMTVRQKIEEDIRVRAERERQRKPEWSEGLVQQRMREESREKQIEEMKESFSRTIDDSKMNEFLKSRDLFEDPMAPFAAKKKKADSKNSSRPTYRGPYQPNRFEIPPGHRWDGVDRSNGFEKRIFRMENEQKAWDSDLYRWATEGL